MNCLTRALSCCNSNYQNARTVAREPTPTVSTSTFLSLTSVNTDHRTAVLSSSILQITVPTSCSSSSSSSSSSHTISRSKWSELPSAIFLNIGSYLSRSDLLLAQAVNELYADHWNYTRSVQKHPKFRFEIAIRSFPELGRFFTLSKNKAQNIPPLTAHLIQRCKSDFFHYRIKLEWFLWKLRTLPNQNLPAVDSLLALIDAQMHKAQVTYRSDLQPYYDAFRDKTLDLVSLDTFPLDPVAMVILIDVIKGGQDEGRKEEGFQKLKQACLDPKNVGCLHLLHELDPDLLKRLLGELFKEDSFDKWIETCIDKEDLNSAVKNDLSAIVEVLKADEEEGLKKLKQLCMKLRHSKWLSFFYDQLGLNLLERLLRDLFSDPSLFFGEWFKFLRPNLPIVVLGHCNAAAVHNPILNLRLPSNIKKTMEACPNATTLILDTDKCPKKNLEDFCTHSFAKQIKSFKITNIDLELGKFPLEFISKLNLLSLEDVEISGTLSIDNWEFLSTLADEKCSTLKITSNNIRLVGFEELANRKIRRRDAIEFAEQFAVFNPTIESVGKLLVPKAPVLSQTASDIDWIRNLILELNA